MQYKMIIIYNLKTEIYLQIRKNEPCAAYNMYLVGLCKRRNILPVFNLHHRQFIEHLQSRYLPFCYDVSLHSNLLFFIFVQSWVSDLRLLLKIGEWSSFSNVLLTWPFSCSVSRCSAFLWSCPGRIIDFAKEISSDREVWDFKSHSSLLIEIPYAKSFKRAELFGEERAFLSTRHLAAHLILLLVSCCSFMMMLCWLNKCETKKMCRTHHTLRW